MDADIVIWSPDEEFTITKDEILFKNKITPYEGRTVRGVIHKPFYKDNLFMKKGSNHLDLLESLFKNLPERT